jgi:16S rRNA (adenine1518-N6/adenine1519-N6)-dimethyltransferase
MTDARALLRQANLSPKKSFGQNFLVSDHVVRAMAAACVRDGEVGAARVVELGAGLGALTSHLLARARHVTAVERDRDLVPLLTREFQGQIDTGKLQVLEADAQGIDVKALLGDADGASPRVLCGNLPYQITGRLLQLATLNVTHVDRVVFMVQDEVADRLIASPGSKEYGALTIFTRAAFDVSRLMKVSRGSFHPAPDVTSSVIVLAPRRPPLAEETATFRALVKQAFAMRRKTLRNAWAAVAPPADIARAAAACDVSLDARGETLSVDQFARVAASLDQRVDEPRRHEGRKA